MLIKSDNVRKLFVPITFLSVSMMIFANNALAKTGGLVPCGPGTDDLVCDVCDFFVMIKKIIDFMMIDIAPALALLLIVSGAVVMMTSGGSQQNYDKGKDIIFKTIIGLLIIFGSWFIINIVMSISTGADTWYKIQC